MIIISLILNIFYIISGIIGIVAIGIVVWDHSMDDRILTRGVRNYYECIERLVFSFYKYTNLNEQLISETYEIEKAKLIESIKKGFIDRDFYGNLVVRNFDEYGKYLGLSTRNNSHFHVNFYIGGEKYIISIKGFFMKYVFEKGKYTSANPGMAFGNSYVITKNELEIIHTFFENLRLYWKQNFTKRKLFRGNLTSTLDFEELIE